MFDIFPQHKNVFVPQDTQLILEAITDRGVTILLVPNNKVSEIVVDPIEMESARRSIKRCYAYSGTERMDSADLLVEVVNGKLQEWALDVLDSVPNEDSVEHFREQFLATHGSNNIIQAYREVELDEALRKFDSGTVIPPLITALRSR